MTNTTQNSKERSVSNDTFLRLSEVAHRTSLGRSTILAWEKAGKFPKAVRLSANKRVWWSADVNNWIREKLEEAGYE